jgi:hypothetical protein
MTADNYILLTGETDYQRAVDTVLAKAWHELTIFDHDLAPLRLDEPRHIAALADFMQRSPRSGLRIVVHDTRVLDSRLPRFMRLAAIHSPRIQARLSPDNLRHLADTHVLADGCHGVRRFHRDHARCALLLDNPAETQPWRQRFEELWGVSQSCLNINTTGL